MYLKFNFLKNELYIVIMTFFIAYCLNHFPFLFPPLSSPHSPSPTPSSPHPRLLLFSIRFFSSNSPLFLSIFREMNP